MAKVFDAFTRAFDEESKTGVNNKTAFDRASQKFIDRFSFSPYKDSDSYLSARSYHHKKKKAR